MNRFAYIQFLALFSGVLISSCTSRDLPKKPHSTREVNPRDIYFDYKIWAEEGNDNLSILLQFLYRDENGPNLTLEDPCTVKMDGEAIVGDSSKITGTFYELIRPIDKFVGDHDIIFTDQNKKQYDDSLSFTPFTLKDIPAVIGRKDVALELEGLSPGDHVRVLVTDTSHGDGINRVDTVNNGIITLTKKDLLMLVNGPLHLELIKEEERPIKNGTATGGVLSISYALKRDIILVDKYP